MKRIECPVCKEKIWDVDPVCPHCGDQRLFELVLTAFDPRQVRPTLDEVELVMEEDVFAARWCLENMPCSLRKYIPKYEAEIAKARFEKLGATLLLKPIPAGDETRIVVNLRYTKCPRCGSMEVTAGPKGGLFKSKELVNRCGKCGYKWPCNKDDSRTSK